MDIELLLSLFLLWISTIASVIAFMFMWFFNNGESFHPHSVDIDHRHSMFVVVHSDTCCKVDFCVKSISAFVAPRGSSSSKQFSVMCVMVSVAGFLGTFRWYRVGDGKLLEVCLALAGFAAVLMLALFEMDVAPDRFLEDKLIVTGWLIQKLNLDHMVDFNVNDIRCEKFLNFIRNSRSIYNLYEEDQYLINRSASFTKFRLTGDLWGYLHVIGAIGYVFLVTLSVFVHDQNERKAAVVTGVFFFLFCLLGYLTGNYAPVLRMWRGYLILWNPFVRDQYFMYHLKMSVLEYTNSIKREQSKELRKYNVIESDLSSESKLTPSSDPPSVGPISTRRGLRRRVSRNPDTPPLIRAKVSEDASSSLSDESPVTSSRALRSSREFQACKECVMIPSEEATREADSHLDNFALRFARTEPRLYLAIVGHLLVMSELVSLLTPAVAIGLQWATALCNEPAELAVYDLLKLAFEYLKGIRPSDFFPGAS